MKIFYEVGDTVIYNQDGENKQGVIVDVDVFEKPLDVEKVSRVGYKGSPNSYVASYRIRENGAENELYDVVVPEDALLSPLHPDTVKFYEEEEGLVDMLGWRKGLESRPDNSLMPEILTVLMAIQYHKEGHYGSSWKGKGEYRGIMSNIDRKYDRLDNITELEIAGPMKTLAEQEKLLASNYDLYAEQTGESKVDAIADLANYTILYMTYVKQNYPLVFKLWVEKNVPPYLAERIAFLQDTHQE